MSENEKTTPIPGWFQKQSGIRAAFHYILFHLSKNGEILRDVAVGQPVFLTKNGHGRYVALDMEEYRQYEKLMAMQKLITELEKGRRSGQEQGYFSLEDVEKELGIHD